MMRLFWSSRSPFVRKVMVVAHETGFAGRLELERVAVGAAILSDALMAHNPLNKIPALVLEDGTTLFDSRVIAEFMDGFNRQPVLFPQPIGERVAALRWQALGDGIMENSTLTLGERKREGPAHSARHVDCYRLKTKLALDLLETEADRLAGSGWHIGAIAIAVALSHLDFRFDKEHWRNERPMLTRWYADIARRESMIATVFEDG
jgi:glutathione S-transferase